MWRWAVVVGDGEGVVQSAEIAKAYLGTLAILHVTQFQPLVVVSERARHFWREER